MDLLLKYLYFLSGFSSAAGPLYLPLYLDRNFSFSKEQIGVLLSLIPVISFLSTPAMTWIGEYKIGLKNAAILASICGIVTFDLYALVTPNVSTTMLFVTGLCVFNALLASPIGTLLDSLVLILSKDYGKQRLWCSVSWGAGSLCTGLLIDYMGLNFIFILFTISSIIFLILLMFLPSSITKLRDESSNGSVEDNSSRLPVTVIEDDEAPLLPAESSKKTLLSLLLKPSTVLFLLSITLIGMVFSLIQSFLFIFMSRELLISSSMIGLTTPLSILFELPVFYYSGDIIKVMGTGMMISLVHILLILRLIVYMILDVKSANFILPVELIHGLAFALTWAAGIEYSNRISSGKSTFVSIFCTLYNNVGGFLGTYIGGKIYEEYGHKYLWMVCIVLLLISFVSFIASRLFPRLDQEETQDFLTIQE